MAITAARTISQVLAHMAIGFGIAWLITGSVVLGGLAVLIEPLINVSLLPLHERAWKAARARIRDGQRRTLALAAEKLSQTGLHMAVAFGGHVRIHRFAGVRRLGCRAGADLQCHPPALPQPCLPGSAGPHATRRGRVSSGYSTGGPVSLARARAACPARPIPRGDTAFRPRMQIAPHLVASSARAPSERLSARKVSGQRSMQTARPPTKRSAKNE